MKDIQLGFGLAFPDLYSRNGLVRIDALFVAHVKVAEPALHERLLIARGAPDSVEEGAESALLVDLAPHLEDFVGSLFGIGAELGAAAARRDALATLYTCKRLFVQRRAAKAHKPAEAEGFDGMALRRELETLTGASLSEAVYASHVTDWLEDEAAHGPKLELAARYAAWALFAAEGRKVHARGILFRQPHKLDFQHLVPFETKVIDGVTQMVLPPEKQRHREAFHLTDLGCDLTGALDQAEYCIYCHNQGKDSCSKGLKDKKTGAWQKSPFGIALAGCPLGEKISEMNLTKARGYSVGALALAVVDNPMVAGTGHRICNDCMKACIYQKQEPVDIPQVETRTLKDVLELPWGFEVYGLLTRWNPLNLRRPLPRPDSGYKVLVVGLGPSGFTLSHHLLNDGHAVVAIDGLKIEPIDPALSGISVTGERVPFRPIRNVADLWEDLNERHMAGFGGVAEYGITVRWNKNFLKVIRLLLERRAAFSMFGGVRFGGTLDSERAFALGFDHVAMCAGAGKPTFIDIPNGLARGVRQASDFLMGLQLTGAAKAESLASLQIRLPVVVVGGGLTAIDTGTESLAYYTVQVEKFLSRYETLIAERGEAAVRAAWNAEEAGIADEFLTHGRAIRAERETAFAEDRPARLRALLDTWGGATVAYRRRLVDAPSYTLNHEEVQKALEEGVRFAEGLTPVAVEIDAYGHASGLRVKGEAGETVLPARSVLIAAGTQPNTVLAREYPGTIELDGKYFQAYDETGAKVSPEPISKPREVQVLMSLAADGRAMSFFGDLHPSFAGNVVKAMASAKQGYPVVSRMLARLAPTKVTAEALQARLNDSLRAVVHEVVRLTPTILEVVLRAPAAAASFKPGQFYRLQNFEALAPKVDGTVMSMEGLALTGAWVDADKGLVSVIVLEMGGSSNLCAHLKPGDPVVLMGPTGMPTETPSGETALLVGGGLGNAVLFSIGQALRNAGSKVLYFAGYKQVIDRYKVEQIEAAADVVVWCCDEQPGFTPTRPQDRTFVGNIVQAMLSYAKGELGAGAISLKEVDRIIAIGSDGMMNAVGQSRHNVLKDYLKPCHEAIGSINSPMQCMMKEICAQCLQQHRDPRTGRQWVVFSCFNQDQNLDHVDFPALRQRLNQNGTQEKLTRQWIDRCLGHLGG